MHLFKTDAVLQEKWIKFVQRHRRDFKPEGKYTALHTSRHVVTTFLTGGDTDESNINKRISTNVIQLLSILFSFDINFEP